MAATDFVDLTENESICLLIGYALRFNLSDKALDSLLCLIDCHLAHRVHRSIYLFLKNFEQPEFKKIYFCSTCEIILPLDNNDTYTCQCSKKYKRKSLDQPGSYFIYLPLLSQLEKLVMSEYYRHARREEENASDIISGSLYKELRMTGRIGDNDLTVQWNTDRVQVFNTSKWSIWPIQVMINELPYNIRKKNILLSSVWFAESKPPMNMFLKPFIDELRELENVGFISKTVINDEPVLIKVHTLCASVDSIARPAIQNQKQFNGNFGCSLCLHPGEISENTKNTKIYPGLLKKLRSRLLHLQFLKKIKESKKPVRGIKGPTVLLLLKREEFFLQRKIALRIIFIVC